MKISQIIKLPVGGYFYIENPTYEHHTLTSRAVGSAAIRAGGQVSTTRLDGLTSTGKPVYLTKVTVIKTALPKKRGRPTKEHIA